MTIHSFDRRAGASPLPTPTRHPPARPPVGHLHLVDAHEPPPRRGGLYCGPERWLGIALTAATADEWAQRLGDGTGALLSVRGAINRGELAEERRGVFTLTDSGRRMIAELAERQPMAQAGPT